MYYETWQEAVQQEQGEKNLVFDHLTSSAQSYQTGLHHQVQPHPIPTLKDFKDKWLKHSIHTLDQQALEQGKKKQSLQS